MDHPTETLVEETFAFPKYAALLDQRTNTAYIMGRVKQLHVSKIMPVQVGPGHLDRATVYEYNVRDLDVCTAVMVRSAWLRPIGSMDGARPLTIQVLLDDVVALEQTIDEHLRMGYPFPGRPCACNGWQKTAECKCPVKPLSCSAMSAVFPAVAVRETGKTAEGHTAGEALQDQPYGVFAPDQTLIQIRVVKPGHGPVDFRARCGITAALYSTRAKDIVA